MMLSIRKNKTVRYRYPEINLQLKIPPTPFRKGGDRGSYCNYLPGDL
jgi:hypothetical protein